MSYHGLHLQTPVYGWLYNVARAADVGKPYRIIKAFWVEAGKEIKAISPNTITVYRKHIEHQDPYLDKAFISPSHADEAADEFIFTFKDSLNQHGNIDYVESLNETYPSANRNAQEKAVAFDRAFIRRLRIHCPGVKPVVYTAPPGNIDHHEYDVLLYLAKECEKAGGAFGYHNYWSVVNKHSYVNSADHAKDYHMRWNDTLDHYLVSNGIRVKHMLGESGAIGAGPTGYWQKPDDGWRHPDVWNADEDGYLSDLAAMDLLYEETLAAREGRLLGATLFTTGQPYVGWEHFQIVGGFLTRLTDYVIGTEPPFPPPPPPPPPPDFERLAWEVTVNMQESGESAIRLNAQAAIQRVISSDNKNFNTDYQIVTTETGVQGRTVQAAESLSGEHPRRVYVWEAGEDVYYFKDPDQ